MVKPLMRQLSYLGDPIQSYPKVHWFSKHVGNPWSQVSWASADGARWKKPLWQCSWVSRSTVTCTKNNDRECISKYAYIYICMIHIYICTYVYIYIYMKMVICGLRLVLNVSMSIRVIPRPDTGSNHPKGGYTCLGSRSQPRATSSKNPGRYIYIYIYG